MMEKNKVFDNPADIGILLRFRDSVKVLCTETGSLGERLYRAYWDCGVMHLHSSNFQDDYIASRLKCIEKMVNIGTQKLNNVAGICFQVKVLRLHWRYATKMACAIFDIYEYLTQLRVGDQTL